jgi:hypothetical protein
MNKLFIALNGFSFLRFEFSTTYSPPPIEERAHDRCKTYTSSGTSSTKTTSKFFSKTSHR